MDIQLHLEWRRLKSLMQLQKSVQFAYDTSLEFNYVYAMIMSNQQ